MKSEPIYIDTNVYIDHFQNRVDKLRPLGEFAFNSIRKSVECEYRIIISSVVLDELEYNGYAEDIKELTKNLKALNKITYTEESEEDIKRVRMFGLKSSINDAKHAVIAIRSKAKYLVTRNIKDFEMFQNLIKIRYPEEL